MKAKLISTRRPTSRTDKSLIIDGLLPAGTVIDHKDAFQLVMMGIATPADDECTAALAARGWGLDVFNAKFAAATAQQARFEKGIRDAILPTETQPEVDDDDTGNSDE